MHPGRATAVAAAIGVVVLAACGSAGGSDAGGGATLQQAARRYADAFLHGSVQQIDAVMGTKCRGNVTASDTQADAELAQLRSGMVRLLGRPLSEVQSTGVRVRYLKETSGDAMVSYNVGRGLAGNDNWVHYRVEDGRWVVADCNLPIGGQSKSSSASTSP